ncbi:MAG: anti-FecI sigma factor, FecR [Verrucomicrobia bacterium]|nr:anti-FecI sigma factor, FecR [Verrucomicrobiota bacterium]
MNPSSLNFIPGSIRAAAAAWRVRQDAGLSAIETEEFNAWIDADERHAMAFGDAQVAWEDLAQMGKSSAGVPDQDVLAPKKKMKGMRIRWLAMPAGLAAAAAIGFLMLRGPASSTSSSASTTSDSRRMELEDGSVIELNAASAVRVAYTAAERHVRLARGEAHFVVAKNPDRPFIVEANGVAVRAVGTAFNVRLEFQKVEVLVTEGRVKVSSPPADPESAAMVKRDDVFVDAGSRLSIPLVATAPVSPVVPVAPAAIEQELAWRERPLVFVDAPLSEVVAAFNRHNHHQLVIADPELAGQKFGGTFKPQAYEAAVRLLEADFGITARSDGDRTLLQRTR